MNFDGENMKMNVNADLATALISYKDAIIADYEKNLACVDEEGNLRFGVEFEEGSKYVKVVSLSWSSRSVHSFVEKATGDIWRAASWKAPARNFARGNVFSINTLSLKKFNTSKKIMVY